MEDVYREIMARDGPGHWKGTNREDQVLRNLMEKIVAERKCRQERSHAPEDLYGQWEKNETHLAEHCPYLNNTSTALRRGIAKDTIYDFSDEMQIMLHPVEADDIDEEGNSNNYDNQAFINEVKHYWEQMKKLGFEAGPVERGAEPEPIVPPPGPTKPGGRGIPYDILEFVPQFPTVYFNTRLGRLARDLQDEVTRCEILCRRGQEPVLRGRTLDKYNNNEHFVDRTLALIIEFLAADPGLTRERMAETAKLFHSMLLEPWYFEYGNGQGRQPGEGGEGHEEHNAWLRDGIIEMDNALAETGAYRAPGFIDNYWDKICYEEVVNTEYFTGILTIGHVHGSALNRWRYFYSNWLQILANVELSHLKATQEELDGRGLTSCIVCGDDYDFSSPYRCAVNIGCENNHLLCKKCYTELSLTPSKPYNDLTGDRHCPECRSVLTYKTALRNLTEGLGLMPSLLTDFPYTSRAAPSQ